MHFMENIIYNYFKTIIYINAKQFCDKKSFSFYLWVDFPIILINKKIKIFTIKKGIND